MSTMSNLTQSRVTLVGAFGKRDTLLTDSWGKHELGESYFFSNKKMNNK